MITWENPSPLAWLIIAIVIISFFILITKETKKEKIKKIEDEKKKILDRLTQKVHYAFNLDLDTINENGSKSEVIRIVNLMAYEIAVACVKEDEERRNNTFRTSIVSVMKIKWSEKRKLALLILPELEDEIPHFSEFEPLKSYNAEHLIKKKAQKN